LPAQGKTAVRELSDSVCYQRRLTYEIVLRTREVRQNVVQHANVAAWPTGEKLIVWRNHVRKLRMHVAAQSVLDHALVQYTGTEHVSTVRSFNTLAISAV
jgi:hypothetical protein